MAQKDAAAAGVGLAPAGGGWAFPRPQGERRTLPADSVIYGTTHSNGLLDETGSAGTPDVGLGSPGSSIERTNAAGSWQSQSTPSPGTAAF